MANDDRRSEQFIREVDEELRRAQLKAIWDRFGVLIIAICVLIVLITAGYRGWVWWQARQAAAAGDQYLAALTALEGGAGDAGAEAALREIAEGDRAGYAVLARMRLAGEAAAAGRKDDALAGYDAVAADAGVVQPLRDVAAIRAAWLALDKGDVDGAATRAKGLNAPGNPWRHAAREVLGLAAYKKGELAEAREFFTAIQQDAETPADLWVRSGMMVQLIDGQLAPPDDAAAENADAEAPAETAADDGAQESPQ